MSTRQVVFTAMIAATVSLATRMLPTPLFAQNQRLQIIQHRTYDKALNMPYAPAIKINGGKLLWLSGNTALPVYHDHPHRREDILKYMPNDLAAQTRSAMDGIKQTLEAAGGNFGDVVHVFTFRARPRMEDIGITNEVVDSYFRPFNHKPASTSVSVLELGEPEQLVEIQMVAVVN